MLYLSAMLWASGTLDRSFGLAVEMRKLASSVQAAALCATLGALLRGSARRRSCLLAHTAERFGSCSFDAALLEGLRAQGLVGAGRRLAPLTLLPLTSLPPYPLELIF